MESGKPIIAIVFIAVAFLFVPKIFSSAFGGFSGGGLFGGGSGSYKTLTQPAVGRGGIIAISYNGGDKFEEAEVHTSNAPQILTIDTYQKFYIAGTDSGLLVSRDGGLNWNPFADLEKQIDANTKIYDFARGPGGALYMAVYKNGHGVLYVTNDNFFTATSIWEEAKISLKAINADRDNLYLGLSDGRLLRYSFANATFDKVTTFESGVKNLVFAGEGNLFAALDNGSVYNDKGTRAKFAKAEITTRSYFASQGGLNLTNDARSSNTLFLSSFGGLFRSENGGTLWNNIDSILPTNAKIAALAIQSGSLYVTSEAKFYKSDDGGKSWTVSEPMPSTQKFGTLYVENDGKTVIVGTTH